MVLLCVAKIALLMQDDVLVRVTASPYQSLYPDRNTDDANTVSRPHKPQSSWQTSEEQEFTIADISTLQMIRNTRHAQAISL